MIKKITYLFFVLMIGIFTAGAQVKKAAPKKAVVNKKSNINRTVIKKIIPAKDKSVHVKITTDSGIIIVRLYDSTPLHRDNFVKLVKEHFYDSLMFHRVIPQFMIQGGDPNSKTAEVGAVLGNGGDNMERIPAEIKPYYFHKKGVLAAARDGNPEKASSACQFYIVEGKKLNDDEIIMAEQRTGRKMTEAEKTTYKTIGGTPWLDGQYTVFGETITGLEVIDKIANMSRNANNRPLTDIRMKIEIIK